MNFVQLCREIKRKNDQIRERPCTCHPDDISPPCEHRYALTDCRMARLVNQRDELAAALREAVAMLDESSSPYIDGCGEDLRWTERRNSMLDEHRALLARLGEGGEG